MKHFHAHSGLTQGLKVLLNNHARNIPLIKFLLPISFDEKKLISMDIEYFSIQLFAN